MFYLIAFVAGIITCAILWKQLIRACYYGGMLIGIVIAWRITQLFDINTIPILIGGISALVVCILFSNYIRHILIHFYLQDAIDKQKQAAQRGRMW